MRRELAVREAGERAVLEPPAHIRRMLGERPERAGSQRERWEQLARDLERYRLEHGVDVDRDGPVGRRPSGRDEEREQLVERIRDLRAERGLSPEAPGLELDVDAPELDLGYSARGARDARGQSRRARRPPTPPAPRAAGGARGAPRRPVRAPRRPPPAHARAT